jgi:glycosyltransferase involved in cell wall biosynthesis
MVIAEALISGVPVITTREAPWKVLEECSCGWWIERSLTSLESSIRTAISLPAEQLAEMGERGKSLMKSRYSWQQVAGEMSCEYQKLISRGC